MLTTMPHCVVMSVVVKFVLKATPAPVNAGYLAETVNGQLHKSNYRVDILQTVFLGGFPWFFLMSRTDTRFSYLSTRLNEVYCTAAVTRPLPSCEHSASMACSATPSEIRCTQICDVERTCCSKRCPARCWECQKLSKTPPSPLCSRTNHAFHSCSKDLFCQHTCKQPCAIGHVCGDCTSECRQSCVHHRCERGCSTPCTPCAEPCLWICPHQSCPVPCGSVSRLLRFQSILCLISGQICTRLPCNLRCPNLLKCSHPCTSLCGEPCENQLCIKCASEDEKGTVVDLTTNNTIADLDLGSNELDSILIRLACGHIFTVGTLDGICELHRFYSSTPDGHWTGLSAPPTGSAAVPPTCPTCRGLITAHRYGRVYKRANLDMLERTVATKMSRRLNELGNRATELLVWSLGDEYSETEIPGEAELRSAEKKQNLEDILKNGFENELPLKYDCLWSLEMHGITKEESETWNRMLKPLLQLYKAVTRVAATRSAHVTAYEASIAMLYREVNTLIAKFQLPSPEGNALRRAKRLVGIGPPLADKRFRVEAIWLSVELRHILGSIALSRCRRIRSVARRRGDQRVVVWSAFVEFIFESCVKDTDLARKITADCNATVQSLEAVAKCCRAILEHAKAKCSVALLVGHFQEERDHWRSEAERLRAQARSSAIDEESAFLTSRGCQTLELDLVEEKLMKPIDLVLEQWDELITGLSTTAFSGAPLSTTKLSAIVKAFPDSAYSTSVLDNY